VELHDRHACCVADVPTGSDTGIDPKPNTKAQSDTESDAKSKSESNPQPNAKTRPDTYSNSIYASGVVAIDLMYRPGRRCRLHAS